MRIRSTSFLSHCDMIYTPYPCQRIGNACAGRTGDSKLHRSNKIKNWSKLWRSQVENSKLAQRKYSPGQVFLQCGLVQLELELRTQTWTRL